MNSKKWRIGFVVALVLSLLTAGAGLAAGMQWQAFVAVFCAAAVSNLGAYLMKHPVESIVEETASSTLTTARDGSTRQVDTLTKTTTPLAAVPPEMPPPYDASLITPIHPGDPRTPATTQISVKSTVQLGVALGTAQYPQTIDYLRAAAPVVCEAAAGTDLQPDWVIAALESNQAALAAKNPEAALIFNHAFALYQILWQNYGGPDAVQNRAQLQAALMGTCQGILAGLPSPAAPASARTTIPLPPHVRPDY